MDHEYTHRKLTEKLDKIEAELERWLPQKIETPWVEKVFSESAKKTDKESIQIPLAPLRDIVSRGGKRWRPLLMTLVCEILGGGDAALELSPLVEFCHNASLIHDDIEDQSNERRGKPAIHLIYGMDTAINSGSLFYFLSTCCIDSCTIRNKEEVYKIWAEYMRRLHLGQAMDINWHRNVSLVPPPDQYFLMCGFKTGSLASFAAELGAYSAGASNETMKRLGKAAEKLGVGFQILDDVKNLTTGIPGKKRGDDIIEGKKSLPVIKFLHKYPEKREMVFNCFHAAKSNTLSEPEIEKLIETLTASGVLKEAEEEGRNLLKEAREIFGAHDLIDGFFSIIS